jgi:translation initiation factor IF-1
LISDATMADQSTIKNQESKMIEGLVVAQLPSGLYEVDVDGRRLTAHVGGGSGRNFVRLLVGDRVAVERTARDLTRGRIVKKL